jgi:group I intron endonuclease
MSVVPDGYFCVYKITNIINGKNYIGQSNDPRVRWNSHKYHSRNDGKKNYHLYASMNKYGIQNFLFDVIAQAPTADLLNFLENDLIIQYDALNSKYGYNKTINGTVNRFISNETKKRMSEAQKGHLVSEEARTKIGNANRNRSINLGAKNGMFNIRSAQSKFTDDQVICIREEFKNKNVTTSQLAIKYKVDRTTIWKLLTNKTYRNVCQ